MYLGERGWCTGNGNVIISVGIRATRKARLAKKDGADTGVQKMASPVNVIRWNEECEFMDIGTGWKTTEVLGRGREVWSTLNHGFSYVWNACRIITPLPHCAIHADGIWKPCGVIEICRRDEFHQSP